ncbi:hypothetical protein [Sporohalobacter salinus]|uniref:hypothetical protein n=1 Tax=Sporohalobacter salinus TaxID=1494606 RepID=UPI0019603C3F|nr:hypothetical protein [Sporohalobacter salinus]MBM7623388.1 hypothetical protein [Sporohalobacter salinus]
MQIEDSMFLGGLAGIIGSIPSFIFNLIFVQLGITEYYTFQISSSIHLLKKFTTAPLGAALGIILWLIASSVLGIIIVYIFKFTGSDYWWFKGIVAVSSLMYIGIYGFLYNLGAQLTPHDLTTNLVLFGDNLLFGLTTAYLITRWGQEIFNKVS